MNYGDHTWSSFFIYNLILVTIGNMIGGMFYVSRVYRVTYLRKKKTLGS
jgi:formate/nitrite transporter FocA (FNT family)